MSDAKSEIPYGTLDLLILKTLDTKSAMQGYRIARLMERIPENMLPLKQGSICPALMQLEQQGWIQTESRISETKRRVKIYSQAGAGSKRLHFEVANSETATALMGRFLVAKA